MQRGFTKLFNTIVTSTIWQEDDKTRIVWITMLAIADANGIVGASIPGLASVANVDLAACEKALGNLHSPDEYSRTQEFEGRRIETVEGGWRILNYIKYRKMLNEEERREYKAKWMREKRQNGVDNGGQSGQKWTQAEAEAEYKSTLVQIEQIYQAYPRKKARQIALKAIAKALKRVQFDELLAKTQAFAKVRPNPNDRFTPLPATWFNQERYNEPPESWSDGDVVKPQPPEEQFKML